MGKIEAPEKVKCPVCKKSVGINKWGYLKAHMFNKETCMGGTHNQGVAGATVVYLYEPTGLVEPAQTLKIGENLAFHNPYRGTETEYMLPGGNRYKLEFIGTYLSYKGKRYNLEGERDPAPAEESV